jgi:hypothetical protein
MRFQGPCSNCHFDPESDSIYAEGAPCGVDGCMSYTCCDKTWKAHCKRVHKEYYNKYLSVHSDLLRKLRRFLRVYILYKIATRKLKWVK